MLLTSGQVSLAISSTIVFIFTTALFLCGYVVQQKTVNDIREAIKPQPRPVHTNLYVPPKPDASPGAMPSSESIIQIVEIVERERGEYTQDPEQEPAENPALEQQHVTENDDEDDEDGLVQGADGGFLRIKTQRGRKRKKSLQEEALAPPDSRRHGGISGSTKSGEGAASRDTAPNLRGELSKAARRRLIKEEFVKLAGEDLLNNPNTYKRRRLW